VPFCQHHHDGGGLPTLRLDSTTTVPCSDVSVHRKAATDSLHSLASSTLGAGILTQVRSSNAACLFVCLFALADAY
jgi:hypothetical protein